MDAAPEAPAGIAFGRFLRLPHRREMLADGLPEPISELVGRDDILGEILSLAASPPEVASGLGRLSSLVPRP
jgi:hypothetical protein